MTSRSFAPASRPGWLNSNGVQVSGFASTVLTCEPPGVRALVQRVRSAHVDVITDVSSERVGEITTGVCVLVGVTHDDTEDHAVRLAAKVADLRIFADDEGVMNRSLLEVDGEALVVSQFTLYGDTGRGRRPGWSAAARPEQAEPLVDRFAEALGDRGVRVATGRFRTDMQVGLVNDGPCTLMLEI